MLIMHALESIIEAGAKTGSEIRARISKWSMEDCGKKDVSPAKPQAWLTRAEHKIKNLILKTLGAPNQSP